MVKILQSTSRGQITLPKKWRDLFDTNYYKVVIKDEELVIKPLPQGKSLKDQVEDSWEEYREGKVISSNELMKKYDL